MEADTAKAQQEGVLCGEEQARLDRAAGVIRDASEALQMLTGADDVPTYSYFREEAAWRVGFKRAYRVAMR